MRGMPVMLSARGGSTRWGERGEEGACVTFPSSPRDTQNKAVHHGKVGRGPATRVQRDRAREGWNPPGEEKRRARMWSHKPGLGRNGHLVLGFVCRLFRVAKQRRHHGNRFRHRGAAVQRRRLATETGHYSGKRVNVLTLMIKPGQHLRGYYGLHSIQPSFSL